MGFDHGARGVGFVDVGGRDNTLGFISRAADDTGADETHPALSIRMDGALPPPAPTPASPSNGANRRGRHSYSGHHHTIIVDRSQAAIEITFVSVGRVTFEFIA